MKAYRINGGKRLSGCVRLSGAKNAALPVLAASLLVPDMCLIGNCPDIADVKKMKYIMEELGCRVTTGRTGICTDTSGLDSFEIRKELMESMRSSIFLMGPLLARTGRADIYMPGGCRIGRRPIDIHIDALSKMGAEINKEDEMISCRAGALRGTDITLPFPSVGATENIMAAAVCAKGTTVIRNAAREPETEDLQNFLNMCGAVIKGAGTDRIVIEGVERLHGCCYDIMPDRIEGGTYLIAAAGTGGNIFLENGKEEHLKALISILEASGCSFYGGNDGIGIKAPRGLCSCGFVETDPFPGFPTDMQPQLMSVMAFSKGKTLIREKIFENRFGIAKELEKMGAEIEIKNRDAIINGVSYLHGAEMTACDLRGGAALCIAALAAEGESVIKGVSHIERGYSDLDRVFKALGADIEKTEIEDDTGTGYKEKEKKKEKTLSAQADASCHNMRSTVFRNERCSF